MRSGHRCSSEFPEEIADPAAVPGALHEVLRHQPVEERLHPVLRRRLGAAIGDEGHMDLLDLVGHLMPNGAFTTFASGKPSCRTACASATPFWQAMTCTGVQRVGRQQLIRS